MIRVNALHEGRLKTKQDVDMRIREVISPKKFNEILDKHLQTPKENSVIEINLAVTDMYFESRL